MAILNDGTKNYDNGKDGAGQETARCSIDYRKTDVTAKAKLTYFKNNFLEVRLEPSSSLHSGFFCQRRCRC